MRKKRRDVARTTGTIGVIHFRRFPLPPPPVPLATCSYIYIELSIRFLSTLIFIPVCLLCCASDVETQQEDGDARSRGFSSSGCGRVSRNKIPSCGKERQSSRRISLLLPPEKRGSDLT